MEITLPAQPPVLSRIVRTLTDSCADVHGMAHTLSPVPELAHGFVRLANTFGRRGRVSSVADAIVELGPRASLQLILCLATKKQLSAFSSHGFAMEPFWLASLRRAYAAHALANALGVGNELSLFSVGFHQDVGVLLSAQHSALVAQAASELADAPAVRRLHAEKRRGMPHDELGLTFCRHWSFPADVAIPVRYHHAPEQAPSAFATAARIAWAAESIADLATTSDVAGVRALAEQALSNLRVNGMLAKLFDHVADRIDDTAEAFGIDAMPEARFAEIRERSQARVSSANVRRIDPAMERELNELRRQNAELRQKLSRAQEELEELRASYPRSGIVGVDIDSLRPQKKQG